MWLWPSHHHQSCWAPELQHWRKLWNAFGLLDPLGVSFLLYRDIELKWNVNNEPLHLQTPGKGMCWFFCVILTFCNQEQCKNINHSAKFCCTPVMPGPILGKDRNNNFTSPELTPPPSDLLSSLELFKQPYLVWLYSGFFFLWFFSVMWTLNAWIFL